MSSHTEASALISSLSDLSSKLSMENSHKAKKEALRLSKALTTTLEEPENVAVELAFSSMGLPLSARIAVDMKLFEHIVSHEGSITATQLASLSGGDEQLIIRILRSLSASGFVKEVSEQTWVPTPISIAMTDPGIAAGHRMLGEMLGGAATKAPKYFHEAGYKAPTDPRDGLMQYAFQTKLPLFAFFATMPNILRDFNMFMGSTMGVRAYWVDWFPVQERVLDDARAGEDEVLIVDVGAGKGHDLLAFQNKFPENGRLVLQDLKPVIEGIGALDGVIEKVEYDFFTEQPILGARVYFYHHILHDWADDKCLEILACVKQAMKPGYSKLLIHEMILPEQGASAFHSMLDLTMMTFNGGMERTGKQWRVLLESAGFEVLKVWKPEEEDADGIVEVVVRE